MVMMDGFNPDDHESRSDFTVLPPAKYLAAMTGSEKKSNAAGTGSYLQFEFTVLEGEYKNRKLWDILNMVNPKATAVAIAKQALAELCRATGNMAPRDTQELHNIPICLDVKCAKRKDNGEIQNRIAHYLPKSEYQAGAATQATQQSGAPAGAAPWKR